ncbi:diacylglycerol kinase family lipid kinase [uncultured Sphaerochaeta sp.]|uniref:diacylglycerol/lipid kinase family protein n=1 Tax=uncultured Sphaerochaeta sp. TaxID=886478 RepID=UPI002A0A8ECF|nr:diacylglycerol kinase family lipid kinase [uncultured Sphaerochaeta sp.]
MVNENLYVILNPHAAKGKARDHRQEIVDCFSKGGFTSTIILTTRKLEATDLAYQAALSGHPIVIAAGGDGTVNEVANGLLKAVAEKGIECPTMGVIPIGRGNDFAWALQLPVTIEKACKAIMEGKIRRIDTGFSIGGLYPEGKYFVNGEGVGFEPLVNFTASAFKHVSGSLSYVFAMIKILIHYPRPYHILMTVDGKEIVLDTQQISICNGKRMGSAFIMGPGAILDDGYFDIVYANQPIKSSHLIPIALRFFKGTQVKLPIFSVIRGKRVTVVSQNNPMPVHVDGEEISQSCISFSAELFPKSLPVFIS